MFKSYWIVAAIVIAILLAAFYIRNTNTNESGTSVSPQTQSFNLVVQKRKVTSGVTTLTVHEGDTVSITITADESDELHLHGYDKHVDFATSTPATLTFLADQSGAFPFEMEGSKTDLGEVDVLP